MLEILLDARGQTEDAETRYIKVAEQGNVEELKATTQVVMVFSMNSTYGVVF